MRWLLLPRQVPVWDEGGQIKWSRRIFRALQPCNNMGVPRADKIIF